MRYSVEIEKSADYDFVVCGGGMTGFACAVAAARKGLKTALIEKQGSLGGVGTNSLVNHLLGGMAYQYNGGFLFYNVRGIFKELEQVLIRKDAAVNPESIDRSSFSNPHGWYPGLADGVVFNNDVMKATLDEMCVKAGVEVYFFSDIIDTVTNAEKDKIESVIIHNKSGLICINGKYFADTTGDADIAYMSGCKIQHGREEDGLMTAPSLEMHVEHVDTGLLSQYINSNDEPRFRKLILELREKGKWNIINEIFISVQLHEKDIYFINMIVMAGVDGTDGEAVSKAMIEGRRETLALFEVMKKHIPGFANARIRQIAPNIGIRETRRIIGKNILTVDELLQGKIAPDSIAVSSYGWDLSDPKYPPRQIMHDQGFKHPGFSHIPYSCLIPDKMSNLIVAGRSISVERHVLGPVRVMAPCMAMGQAAGTAASMAFEHGISFDGVNTRDLQAQLDRDGCVYSAERKDGEIIVNGRI